MSNKKWFKNDESDVIWWKDIESFGARVFSFDKKTEFNLFADYPYKLNRNQKEIFDRENPGWRDFFKDRY